MFLLPSALHDDSPALSGAWAGAIRQGPFHSRRQRATLRRGKTPQTTPVGPGTPVGTGLGGTRSLPERASCAHAVGSNALGRVKWWLAPVWIQTYWAGWNSNVFLPEHASCAHAQAVQTVWKQPPPAHHAGDCSGAQNAQQALAGACARALHPCFTDD